MMLCKVCIGVLKCRANLITVISAEDEKYGDGPTIVNAHHETTQSLEASAAVGCHICRAFWDQLSLLEKEALRAAEVTCRRKGGAESAEQLEPGEELLTWLTITLLARGQMYGGDFALIVAFSGDGFDWRSVSPREKPAQGIHILQMSAGRLVFGAICRKELT